MFVAATTAASLSKGTITAIKHIKKTNGEVNTPILEQRTNPPSTEYRESILQPNDIAEVVSTIVKLPASASAGDTLQIKDYAANFGTNNLTIQRNGHNIQGVANDGQISTNRASLTLVYIDATKGWLYTNESNVADLQQATYIAATGGTITTSGDYKTHVFTGDGNFVVSSVGNPAGGPSIVDYLVVGAGGDGTVGGGGGSGLHPPLPHFLPPFFPLFFKFIIFIRNTSNTSIYTIPSYTQFMFINI